MAADAVGNVYLTGAFAGSVCFGPGGSDLHTSNGGTDVFVTKLGWDGGYLWTRTFGGSDDDLSEGLAVDAAGNVYVVGIFRGLDVDFDPTTGVDTRSSNGSADVFLVRLEADGAYGWCATIGGNEFDHGKSVAVSVDSYLVVVGYFAGSAVDFDPTNGTDPHSAVGSSDVFVTRLALDGQYDWTVTAGGDELDICFGVALGPAGTIALTGWFNSPSVDFDPGSGEDWHVCNGASDAYVMQLGVDSSYLWTRTFGGPQFEHGYSVAVDGAGNIYASGNFDGAGVDFDPGSGVDLRSSNGWYDAFLSSFTAAGDHRFCRTFGGPFYDVGRGLSLNDEGRLLLTGGFEGFEVDFDDGPDSDLHTSQGFSDIFVTEFASDGGYGWTRTVGGSDPDLGYATATGAGGDVVIAGYFSGAGVDFDPTDGSALYDSAGLGDLFVASWHAAVPGDSDCDGDVDLDDYAVYASCMVGPCVPVGPGCATFDFDGDSDVDLADFAQFSASLASQE
jgi:hypothetical protein